MSLIGSQHGKREQVLDFGGLLGGLDQSMDATEVELNRLVDALNMHYDKATGKLVTRPGLYPLTPTGAVNPIHALYIGVVGGNKKLVAASTDGKLYEMRNDLETEVMLATMLVTSETWKDQDSTNFAFATEYVEVYHGATSLEFQQLGAGHMELGFLPTDGTSDGFGDAYIGFGDQKVGYQTGGLLPTGHYDWARRGQNNSGRFYQFRVIRSYMEKGSAWSDADITVNVYAEDFTTLLATGTIAAADIPANGSPDWVTITLDKTAGIPIGEYFYVTYECGTQKTVANDHVQLYVPLSTPYCSYKLWGGAWVAPVDGYGPTTVLSMYETGEYGLDMYTGYPSDTEIRFAIKVSEETSWVLGGSSWIRFYTDENNYAQFNLTAAHIDDAGFVVVSIARGDQNGTFGDWDSITGTVDFTRIREVRWRLEGDYSQGLQYAWIDYLHLYSAAFSGADEIGTLSGNLVPNFANFLEVGGQEAIFIASGEVLQYWTGGGGLVNVNNSPRCSMVVAKSGRLFVNDLDEPDTVKASGILEHDEWDYPLGLFAQVGWPDGDEVVGMHVIGNDLVAFKGAVHKRVVRLVGVYPEWSLKEIARGTSVMNNKSIAQVGANTFILDVDGINNLKQIETYGEMQISPISDVLGDGLTSRVDNTGFIVKWPVNAAILVKPSLSDDRLYVLHYDITPEGSIALKWTYWEFLVPNISCGVYDYETDTIYFGSSDGFVYSLSSALWADDGSPFNQTFKTKVLYEPGRQLLLKELILDVNELNDATLDVLYLTDRGDTEDILYTTTISDVQNQTIRSKARRRSRDIQLGLRISGGGGVELNKLIARVAVVGRD